MASSLKPSRNWGRAPFQGARPNPVRHSFCSGDAAIGMLPLYRFAAVGRAARDGILPAPKLGEKLFLPCKMNPSPRPLRAFGTIVSLFTCLSFNYSGSPERAVSLLAASIYGEKAARIHVELAGRRRKIAAAGPASQSILSACAATSRDAICGPNRIETTAE